MGLSSLAVMANSLTLHLYGGSEISIQNNSPLKSTSVSNQPIESEKTAYARPYRIQQRAGQTVL